MESAETNISFGNGRNNTEKVGRYILILYGVLENLGCPMKNFVCNRSY